jgi:hypothetical protein
LFFASAIVDRSFAIPLSESATRFWVRSFRMAIDVPKFAAIFAAKLIESTVEGIESRTRVAESAVVRNELMVPPTDEG